MQRSYLVAVVEGEELPDHPCLVAVVEGEELPDHPWNHPCLVVVVVEVVVVVLHMLTRNNVCLLSYSLVDLCSWKVLLRSR